MKRSGFSMIELVFVIVILGVLAAVAVPRFVTTRTDAMVAMYRSDIASAMKQIQAKIFAANLNAASEKGYEEDVGICGQNSVKCKSWGDWIMLVVGLDTARWEPGGGGINGGGNKDMRGIQPNGITNTQAGGAFSGCGKVLWIDWDGTTGASNNTPGTLIFDPTNIPNTLANNNHGGGFCDALKKSYPSGYKVEAALVVSNSVSW